LGPTLCLPTLKGHFLHTFFKKSLGKHIDT
jgi:hypothetical protein